VTIRQIIITCVFAFSISTAWNCASGTSGERSVETSGGKVYSTYISDSIPAARGFVNDFENLFSDSEEGFLDSIISSFEKETTIECAIITVPRSMTDIEYFDQFTLQTARAWGVGKKESSNGIVIAFSKSLRKIRIENGKGIVPYFSNDEAKTIIDSIFIPSFKEDEYFQGTTRGVEEIFQMLRQRVR
jgi:uncharacterized protein